MAQFGYQGIQNRAHRIMKRYGFDSVAGNSFLERDGVRRAVTLIESAFTKSDRNDLFEPGDVRFILSVVGETLPPSKENGDIVVITTSGVEQEFLLVVEPERVSPGGVNIFWQLHCRPK